MIDSIEETHVLLDDRPEGFGSAVNIKREECFQHEIWSYVKVCYEQHYFADLHLYAGDSPVPIEARSLVLLAASPTIRQWAVLSRDSLCKEDEKFPLIFSDARHADLQFVIDGIYNNSLSSEDLFRPGVDQTIEMLKLQFDESSRLKTEFSKEDLIPSEGLKLLPSDLPGELKSDMNIQLSRTRADYTPEELSDILYPCKICNEVFLGELLLQTHGKTQHGQIFFCCKLCPHTSKSSKDVSLHERTVHFKEKPFPCQLCDKAFSHSSILKRHVIRKHPETPSSEDKVCPCCHSEHEALAKCCQCSAEFEKENSLQSHLRNVHLPTNAKNADRVFCSDCGKGFTSANRLKKHMSVQHKIEVTGSEFVCHVCGKVFVKKSSLRIHVAQVHNKEKNFKCQECDAAFIWWPSLRTHVKNVHRVEEKIQEMATRTRDHLCAECGKGFFTRFAVEMHVQLVHMKLRKFKCDICKNNFATNQTLQAHIKAIHEGNRERNYVCEFCNQRFAEVKYLRAHKQAIHENRRDHKCHICGKGFNFKGPLQRHIKYVHEGFKEEKVPCEICGKVLSTKNHLGRHLKKIHGMTLKQCQMNKNTQSNAQVQMPQPQPSNTMLKPF